MVWNPREAYDEGWDLASFIEEAVLEFEEGRSEALAAASDEVGLTEEQRQIITFVETLATHFLAASRELVPPDELTEFYRRGHAPREVLDDFGLLKLAKEAIELSLVLQRRSVDGGYGGAGA